MAHPIGQYRFDGVVAELEMSSEVPSVGDTEDIEVRLTDRSQRWEIDSISCDLDVYYRTANGYETETIASSTISDDLSTLTGLTEVRRIPVSIPYDAPNTVGSVDVSATVEFDSSGSTAEYEEFLTLGPLPQFQMVLASMLDLGFALENSECRVDRTSGGRNFVQVLTFAPRTGRFRDEVGELDLFVQTGEETVALRTTVDPDDDQYAVPRTDELDVTVSETDIERIRDEVEQFLERNLPG